MFKAITRRSLLAGSVLLTGSAYAGSLLPQAYAAGNAPKPVILVVSFGTSYNASRHITIGAIEDTIREQYAHDFDIRKAFTSQTIIETLASRDGIQIDNVEEALNRCLADGVKTLIVQPTHLMNGYEYTELAGTLKSYGEQFDALILGAPLLSAEEDFTAVADALAEAFKPYDDGETACVLVGWGTEADSNEVYATLQEALRAKDYDHFYVGTVEAEPTCNDVISAATEAGLSKAVLRPLTVTAGAYATNAMADLENPESWASKFTEAGFHVTCIVEGL
ncbi:MAG: sirohydrochlorin cobaltochelatase, partial [Coriobacteriales bacterium]|nr:sirohydrochlorin cobaltochelatase [Coriobacteriales bacterium]